MASTSRTSSSEIDKRHPWLFDFRLNERQRAFVLHYLETLNATQAAERAGYRSPRMQGSRLMTNDDIQRAIARGRDHIARLTDADPEGVVRAWLEIATADPLELVTHKRVACRYCRGQGHAFQWKTEREFDEALREAVWTLYGSDTEEHATRRAIALERADDHPSLPTDAGGFGYNATRAPNPECPECDGLGLSRVIVADLDSVSPGARALFDGLKVTRHGVEVRLRSRDEALLNLARHLGMFPPATPAPPAATEDGLARLIRAINARSSPMPVYNIVPDTNRSQQLMIERAPVSDTDLDQD
jgi:phage terminase small subunit